jgi:acetylornithine deacetylase/succinyl-diaminopimelate desuccinylase-like protein
MRGSAVSDAHVVPTARELTRRLVRTPTVNPPGDEAAAQDHVRAVLESAGVTVEEFSAAEGRPNLVARLDGRGERPAVVLHGHVDVVGVEGQRWRHPPFDGVVDNGVLHGRGTLDNKGGVAMLTHAFVRAVMDGVEPSGDVVLISAADSETGASRGLAYLLDTHPEVIDGAAYAIGEFGGFPLHAFGRAFYRIGVGLKRYAHLRVRLRGHGGHGSRPATGTVLGTLGAVLARLDAWQAPHDVTPVTRQVIEALAGSLPADDADQLRALLDATRFDEALDRLGRHRATFEAMFRDTANPTIVTAGAKFNVTPSEAMIEIDCRLLPGHDVETLVDHVREIAGNDAQIEIVDAGPPSPTDFDATLLGLLSEILTDLDPDAVPVPYLFSESPDGRLFAAHDVQHYGFLPMNLPPDIDLPNLVHAPDERVPLDAIEFGAEALYQLITRY